MVAHIPFLVVTSYISGCKNSVPGRYFLHSVPGRYFLHICTHSVPGRYFLHICYISHVPVLVVPSYISYISYMVTFYHFIAFLNITYIHIILRLVPVAVARIFSSCSDSDSFRICVHGSDRTLVTQMRLRQTFVSACLATSFPSPRSSSAFARRGLSRPLWDRLGELVDNSLLLTVTFVSSYWLVAAAPFFLDMESASWLS